VIGIEYRKVKFGGGEAGLIEKLFALAKSCPDIVMTLPKGATVVGVDKNLGKADALTGDKKPASKISIVSNLMRLLNPIRKL
jgi:hypothetical protein